MTFLKRLLGGLLAIVLVGVIGAYLLPREVSVARSVVIEAPPEEVYPQVANLRNFAEWSPWHDRDPDLRQTFSGPEIGVGNRMEWASDVDSVGSGAQEITAVDENRRVETALDFGAMGTANAWFDLQPNAEGTEVTWSFTTDLGLNPVARWMGLMMDRWVGGDYERGLAKLKARVEDG